MIDSCSRLSRDEKEQNVGELWSVHFGISLIVLNVFNLYELSQEWPYFDGFVNVCAGLRSMWKLGLFGAKTELKRSKIGSGVRTSVPDSVLDSGIKIHILIRSQRAKKNEKARQRPCQRPRRRYGRPYVCVGFLGFLKRISCPAALETASQTPHGRPSV